MRLNIYIYTYKLQNILKFSDIQCNNDKNNNSDMVE